MGLTPLTATLAGGSVSSKTDLAGSQAPAWEPMYCKLCLVVSLEAGASKAAFPSWSLGTSKRAIGYILAIKFVVCLDKQDLGDFSNVDITVGRVYELVEENAGNDMMRIIDESGEDYLYPSSWFATIVLGDSTAIRLHDALTRLSV